jgi:excisionase family DNA binding protein
MVESVKHALSLRQAAKRIGVHPSTLLRWVVDGEGPRTFIKVGRRSVYRIATKDLQQFIDQRSRGGN